MVEQYVSLYISLILLVIVRLTNLRAATYNLLLVFNNLQDLKAVYVVTSKYSTIIVT